MAIGLIGQKCGMSRVFTEKGESIPVTLVHVEPNRVTQIKTLDTDGYNAIQVTTGTRKPSKVNKAMAGHFSAAKVEAGRGLWEFRITPEELILPADNPEEASEDKAPKENKVAVGSEFTVNVFSEGQLVDIAGTSKGKGFAGTVKRHNFKMQDATHGNSLSHRAGGSIGQNQSPGRVFKGKKMAGQMGNKRCSVQNLKIVAIDSEKNLLLIKGAVPGAPAGDVVILPAVKSHLGEKG